MAVQVKVVLVLIAVVVKRSGCAVLELDDRFLEARHHGMWLVQFYAPWCGHCKKLEPIYHQAALSLRSSSINVAKIDSTRFSSIASEFGVRGFPTIKFINGENVYTHKGERSKEDIVEFAIRAKGPAVRKLSSIGKFNEAKGDHSEGSFFLYVGDEDPEADLFIKYADLAQQFIVTSYFYNGTEKIVPKEIKLQNYPTVLVFKDGNVFEFLAPDGMSTKASLEKWIVQERVTAFPLVTGGNLNEIADIKKFIVILVIDVEDKEEKTQNDRIKSMGEILAKKHREEFHQSFQFVWMSDSEAVNSIVMWSMPMPNVLVLDPETHLYYLPGTVNEFTIPDFQEFLRGVQNGSIQAYGGTGFFQRLKRVFYDLFTMVLGVWQTSRWLFLLMFGLPTTIISIVCYSLCCMEAGEDDGEDFGSDEDDDEREITREISQLQELQQLGEKALTDAEEKDVSKLHPKSD